MYKRMSPASADRCVSCVVVPGFGASVLCWVTVTWAAGFEHERACWDPKDGELCLNRVKPEETLVEARSGSDVQIDRQIWV